MNAWNSLSRAAIDDFKTAYEKEFGKSLSDSDVQEIAHRLLRFFNILASTPNTVAASKEARRLTSDAGTL
jgi:hypothetical protein